MSTSTLPVREISFVMDAVDELLVFESIQALVETQPLRKTKDGRKPDWVGFADSFAEFEDTAAVRGLGNRSIPPTFVDRVDSWLEFDDRNTEDLLERKLVILRKATLPDELPTMLQMNETRSQDSEPPSP